jgi:hypothetical protein
MSNQPRPISETMFDLAYTDRKVRAAIYAPVLQEDRETWTCAYTVDAPLSLEASGSADTSLRALVEAMRGLSRALHGSAEYRDKQLGLDGVFGQYLGLPVTTDLLNIAPHPF